MDCPLSILPLRFRNSDKIFILILTAVKSKVNISPKFCVLLRIYELYIKSAGGEDFNQFLIDIPSF